MDSISEKHIENGKTQFLMVLILGIITIFFSLFAMGQGSSSNLDMMSTIKIIFRLETATELQSDIIWKLRFPRILMAIIGGAALAVAGSLMQGCLGNPLVSPLTLGVASGAALGAAFAIVLGVSVLPYSNLAIVANAFFFSLIVVAVSYTHLTLPTNREV